MRALWGALCGSARANAYYEDGEPVNPVSLSPPTISPIEPSPAPAETVPEPMPRVVKIVAFLMVTQLLCGFWVAGMSVIGLFPSAILREALIRIAVVEMVWHLLMAAVLIRPFLMRSATAWAAVESILLCTAASSA